MKWREINGYNLKPCPFCGSDDVHLTETILTIGGEETGVKSEVFCYGCLGTFSQQEACSPEEVAEVWNRRPKKSDEDYLVAYAAISRSATSWPTEKKKKLIIALFETA